MLSPYGKFIIARFARSPVERRVLVRIASGVRRDMAKEVETRFRRVTGLRMMFAQIALVSGHRNPLVVPGAAIALVLYVVSLVLLAVRYFGK